MVATTKVSSKGQVILPKAVREQKDWKPGTALSVEVTDEGVILRDISVFPRTRPEDVFGMIAYDGPPRTTQDMDAAVTEELKRRHARGRY